MQVVRRCVLKARGRVQTCADIDGAQAKTTKKGRASMGSEQAVVMNYTSTIKRKVGRAKQSLHKDVAVHWDPAWFSQPTTAYNGNLAVVSMALSLAAYDNTAANSYINITQALENLGCAAVDTSSYVHRTVEDTTDYASSPDLVAYAFGHCPWADEAGETRSLVVVAVRGTAPTVEWNSNGNVADSVKDGAYDKVMYHEGFKHAEEELLGRLTSYMAAHAIDGSQACIWVTGHSRGAAVANLLAADLNEGALGFSTNRVFAYTFAAPSCTRRPDATSERFANIFNIVNPEDYIPRLPLHGWGFKRFGQVLYLPSVATTYEAFLTFRPVAEQLFEQIAETPYETFGGTAKTNLFVRHALNLCPTLADLYREPHYARGGGLTFRCYFYDFTNECAEHGVAKREAFAELVRASEGAYAPLFSYFFDNQVLQQEIPFGHAAEGYLAKLMALQQLKIDIRTLTPGDTVHVTFYGVADVLVTDEHGRGVAAIKNGRVDETFAAKPQALAVFVDDTTGAASLWFPQKLGYELQVAGVAETTARATCLWSHEDPEGGVGERAIYEDLALPPLALTPWDAVVAEAAHPTYVHGSPLSVNVSIVGDGDAVGVAQAVEGDRVAVEAYHGSFVHFKGWYEGREVSAGAQPVGTKRTYVFSINRNRDLTAVFERF